MKFSSWEISVKEHSNFEIFTNSPWKFAVVPLRHMEKNFKVRIRTWNSVRRIVLMSISYDKKPIVSCTSFVQTPTCCSLPPPSSTTTPCLSYWFVIFFAMKNDCSSTSEIIRWSCFWVVACVDLSRLNQLNLSIASTDWPTLHCRRVPQWIVFATSIWFSCETFGWLDKNVIQYTMCALLQRNI